MEGLGAWVGEEGGNVYMDVHMGLYCRMPETNPNSLLKKGKETGKS